MNYTLRLLPIFAAFSLLAGGGWSATLAAQQKHPPAETGASAPQLNAYLKLVKAKLEHHFSPASAPKGHATVTFRINKDGRIFWMELTDASGTGAVNQAAEDAVANVRKMPTLPNGLDHIDVAASFDSNIENSTMVHYSRPSPDRVREAAKLAAGATKDIEGKRYLAAVENLRRALLLTPFDVNLRDRAAETFTLAAKNNTEDAEYSKELLHEALLIDPENELARRTLNELCKFNQVGALQFDEHLRLAREYKAKGKPVDALAEYGEAWRLKQDPTLVTEINAVCKLQDAYRNLEKWKSVAESSRTAENLQIVAKAYEQCGDVANAKACFGEALGLDPGCESAKKGLADLAQLKPDVAPTAVETELSDIFPYVVGGLKGISLHEVKNRQPSVDYLKWACQGDAVHRWTPGRFPLRLFVESGAGVRGWHPQLNKMLADALAAWCVASENRITFVQVFDIRGANITCKWTADPAKIPLANAQGYTYFEYKRSRGGGKTSNDTINKGDITILTTSRQDGSVLPDFVMKSVCIHEVGHALGLFGHSPFTGDIMYPSLDWQAVRTTLSAQDKNTIKRLYQGYEHPAK